MICEIKEVFDPANLFNPGKIVNGLPIDSNLRNEPGSETPDIPIFLDFSDSLGIVRAVEKCNGSGDCRKSHLMGGTMCPSYQATLDEKNTTRARANILREFLYRKPGRNPFDHPEILEILDLCLSCKACKSECPSGVDMAKLKAEFLFNWYKVNPIPLKSRLIANLPALLKWAYPLRNLFNLAIEAGFTGNLIRKVAGMAEKRSIPGFSGISVKHWSKHNLLKINASGDLSKGRVLLFVDEFTNYQETESGLKTILLLTKLGYTVIIPEHGFSGRTFISKGFLQKARKMARRNVATLGPLVNPDLPLIGIEPSAILGFRDEYPELVGDDLRSSALKLAQNVFLLEEFLAREIRVGRIGSSSFIKNPKEILLHGHCQQKAVAGTGDLNFVLGFPENYTCREINSGCCGMAGAFGYEKEHYELSMKVGELALFPAVRESQESTVICAPGTSCRHHILDGTGRKAFHPAEILYAALA
jgi:Fe-S oxidoreductase